MSERIYTTNNTVFETETETLVARFSTPPTTVRKIFINETIKQLKIYSIWDKLDFFYVLAAADSQAASLNWKGTSNTITEVNSPLFTADRGYSGNGTTSYLYTNYSPFTGTTWTLNSASFGVYNRTNIAENKPHGSIDVSGNGTLLSLRNSGNQVGGRVNTATNVLFSNSDARGLTVMNRSSSTIHQIYKNGVQLSSTTQNSTSIPNLNLSLLARNVAGTPDLFSAAQLSAAYGGSGDINHTAFYNIIQAYMTNVGANV